MMYDAIIIGGGNGLVCAGISRKLTKSLARATPRLGGAAVAKVCPGSSIRSLCGQSLRHGHSC